MNRLIQYQTGILTLATVWLMSVLPAAAADHRNLESQFPVQIEDATPIPFRAFEIQGGAVYEREGNHGTDAVEVEPELKWGLMKNAHLGVGLPLQFAEDQRFENGGDISMEGFYNFNVESVRVPAFAIKSDFLFPSGEDSRGVDFEVLGIVTKGWGTSRLHFNGGYERNSGADDDERTDLYRFGLGFDHPLNLDNLVVADVFVERAPKKNADPRVLFSTGIRTQLNPWSVFSFGLGSGFGDGNAPDFTATVGFQMSY